MGDMADELISQEIENMALFGNFSSMIDENIIIIKQTEKAILFEMTAIVEVDELQGEFSEPSGTYVAKGQQFWVPKNHVEVEEGTTWMVVCFSPWANINIIQHIAQKTKRPQIISLQELRRIQDQEPIGIHPDTYGDGSDGTTSC